MTDKINQRSFKIDSLLHLQKRWKLAVSLGSIILVIGVAGTFYFGSLNVTQEVKENVNPQTGLPNAVNGIPPAQAQLVFEILIFIGLLILAYGITTRYTRLNRKEQ
jgi:TRAP-type C4-dicarboxylate transport system permease small subunit